MYKLYDTGSVIFLLSSVLLTLQMKIKSLNKYTESLTIKGIFHFENISNMKQLKIVSYNT